MQYLPLFWKLLADFKVPALATCLLHAVIANQPLLAKQARRGASLRRDEIESAAGLWRTRRS